MVSPTKSGRLYALATKKPDSFFLPFRPRSTMFFCSSVSLIIFSLEFDTFISYNELGINSQEHQEGVRGNHHFSLLRIFEFAAPVEHQDENNEE